MTTWTEAQIDRHLHLWEHRHGPDSPEAGIVRQLREERDAVMGITHDRSAMDETGRVACDCISYNRPDLGGKTPEVVLQVPKWAKTAERKTVCVDACIAGHVKALWDFGIWTLNSCCGHNGAFPRSIIVDRADHAAAQRIMGDRDADITVMSWQLCRQPFAALPTTQETPHD